MKRFSVPRLAACGLLIAGLVALIAVSTASAQTPTVSVGSTGTNVGSHGEVHLRALDIGAPGLGAWTIDVSYDPAYLNVVECAPDQGGLCNPAYGEHTVRITGTNIAGLLGDTTLGAIVFGCKQVGSGELKVSLSVFADATLGGPRPIDAAMVNGKVTCLEEGVPTPTPEPVGKKGDVNCDEHANAIDAALVLQLTAGLIDGLPCAENGDVNHDGEIGSVDAALILQMDAGLA